MKTEKIARLLSALGTQSSQQTAAHQNRAAATVERAPENADAVKLSATFGGGLKDVEEFKDSDRVSRLKAQVQNGSYKPKSEDVAAALIRDLGI
ncbi:MAG: flagellar biosynthesis anti-sigma factor FlgM [Deltaproteobacteria bacterium]|nr:flagellar biosynthesis anti-sigma factor FlgM [Deltaproteobacteria bacterium]